MLCRIVSAAMEGMGFLDALNSAPVPGIKIKKKKPSTSTTANTKAVSPTSNKVVTGLSLFDLISNMDFQAKTCFIQEFFLMMN